MDLTNKELHALVVAVSHAVIRADLDLREPFLTEEEQERNQQFADDLERLHEKLAEEEKKRTA